MNRENESRKYKLVYCFGQKSLLLYDLMPYMFQDNMKDGKADNVLEVLERKPKNLFTVSSSQLVLGIYALKSFCITFVKSSKS